MNRFSRTGPIAFGEAFRQASQDFASSMLEVRKRKEQQHDQKVIMASFIGGKLPATEEEWRDNVSQGLPALRTPEGMATYLGAWEKFKPASAADQKVEADKVAVADQTVAGLKDADKKAFFKAVIDNPSEFGTDMVKQAAEYYKVSIPDNYSVPQKGVAKDEPQVIVDKNILAKPYDYTPGQVKESAGRLGVDTPDFIPREPTIDTGQEVEYLQPDGTKVKMRYIGVENLYQKATETLLDPTADDAAKADAKAIQANAIVAMNAAHKAGVQATTPASGSKQKVDSIYDFITPPK